MDMMAQSLSASIMAHEAQMKLIEKIRLYWIELNIEALNGRQTKYDWSAVPAFIEFLCKDRHGRTLGFTDIPAPIVNDWIFAYPICVFQKGEVPQNFLHMAWQHTLEQRPRTRNFIEKYLMRRIRIAAEENGSDSLNQVTFDMATHVTYYKGDTLATGSISDPHFQQVEGNTCIMVKEGLTDDPIAVNTNDIVTIKNVPFEQYPFYDQALNPEGEA